MKAYCRIRVSDDEDSMVEDVRYRHDVDPESGEDPVSYVVADAVRATCQMDVGGTLARAVEYLAERGELVHHDDKINAALVLFADAACELAQAVRMHQETLWKESVKDGPPEQGMN